VRLEILRLRAELAIWTREQELIGNQPVESRNVCRKLRRTQLRLERNDLGVRRANQNRLQLGHVGENHPAIHK
jgi:hypothetical protein